jgi:hypothetical protein
MFLLTRRAICTTSRRLAEEHTTTSGYCYGVSLSTCHLFSPGIPLGKGGQCIFRVCCCHVLFTCHVMASESDHLRKGNYHGHQ